MPGRRKKNLKILFLKNQIRRESLSFLSSRKNEKKVQGHMIGIFCT